MRTGKKDKLRDIDIGSSMKHLVQTYPNLFSVFTF